MILYGLKTCDTCRKALKALPDAEFVDVRATGVPPEVLRAALDQFGGGFGQYPLYHMAGIARVRPCPRAFGPDGRAPGADEAPADF